MVISAVVVLHISGGFRVARLKGSTRFLYHERETNHHTGDFEMLSLSLPLPLFSLPPPPPHTHSVSPSSISLTHIPFPSSLVRLLSRYLHFPYSNVCLIYFNESQKPSSHYRHVSATLASSGGIWKVKQAEYT